MHRKLPSEPGVIALPEEDLREEIRWLVTLRWIAILGVIAAVAVSAHVLRIVTHWVPLYAISVVMAAYNAGYSRLLRGSLSPRALALSQITLDLAALTALLHYSGGVENPFSLLFVFHVILASILLPARQSYAVATLAACLLVGLAVAESLGILPHHSLAGYSLLRQDENRLLYVSGILAAIVLVIFCATYLTVTIAARLRRRSAEVRYLLDYNQSLVDHLPGKVCVVDRDFRIRFASDLVRREMKTRSSETCYAILCDETEPCPGCPLSEVMDSRRTLSVTRELADGRICDHTLSPLFTPDGEPMVLARSQEITEQVELQRKLALSEKLAVIGEMAAGLAHDLGNPLDGAQRALDLVRRRVPDSTDVHPFLDLMEQGFQRMGFIVRRLLVIGRQDELRKRALPVADVIESALLFLEPRIQELGITVEKTYAPLLPLVLADPDSLPQALTNLLQNAVEAIGDGNGRIHITVSPAVDRQERRCVEIQIADSGCGISPRHLARVFDPFFTTKPPGKGTGLGLAMTKRIIHNHGGEIHVTSRPGKGTTFTISIAADEEEQEGSYGRRNHLAG